MSSTQKVRQNARALFTRHLRLLAAGRVREWVELFAEDGALELAFCPPGIPWRYAGHRDLHEYPRYIRQHAKARFSPPTFHATEDPELVIAEYHSRGVAVTTRRAFTQTYLSMAYIRKCRITLLRDFWNPLVVLDAFGGPEARDYALGAPAESRERRAA
ncbi:nuclear transport factor 2 family protein [Amycolatopsis sp. NPDC059021]|uniref:nuclear transport factor 2 family protein n=1 Tax=Amycolatopsis sp. NPDC059021 TaxID=3346704 RepID=UPI0036716B2B